MKNNLIVTHLDDPQLVKMSLVSCIVLSLVYSSRAQPIGDLNEESEEIFSLQNYGEEIPDDLNCPKDELSRISNGNDAKEGQFPFVVALIRWKNNPNLNDQFCVGTLYTWDVVVTACHCLVKGDILRIRYPHDMIDPQSVDISAGTVDLNNYITRRQKGTAKSGQVRRGKKAVVHLKCSRSKNKITHDFGLLKADRPFYIVPVFVPGQVKPLNVSKKYNPRHRAQVDKMANNHTLCTTLGWGLNAQGNSVNILQVIHTTMRPGNWCSEKIKNITIHQKTGPDVFAPRSQICVVGCGTGQTVCPGDSGGPLMCGEINHFVGVVSYGPGDASCGRDQYPFVYARTDANDLWIWATIAGLDDDEIVPKSVASILHMSRMAVTTAIIVIKETLS